MAYVFTDGYHTSPEGIDGAQSMLGFLTEAFSLYPHPDEPFDIQTGQERTPKPNEWGAFLMRYPQYIDTDTKYQLPAEVFAASRESVDGLSPDMQNLAASVIAVTLNETELLEIANS